MALRRATTLLVFRSARPVVTQKLLSTVPAADNSNTATAGTSVGRIEKISNAMRSYLEQARKREEKLIAARDEYELGKRHLANMMGWDPETITQTDIDSAISYLLPSGLFNKKARPMMKPPDELFPQRKAPQFDVQGRPHSYLFYTGYPNYYQIMTEIYDNLLKLNEFEDQMITKGMITAPPEARVNLSSSEWIKYDDFRLKILEHKLQEQQYKYMITSLETLAQHPYSSRIEPFFMKYRQELVAVAEQMEVVPLTYDETGRPFTTAEGKNRNAKAQVTIRGNGTGKVDINGQDLFYFPFLKEREQIMFPLQFTNLMFKVDLEATVRGGGLSQRALAIRLATAMALRSFVDAQTVEDMRIAGLLTEDIRRKERKMYGQWGSRRMMTWRKR